MVIERSTEQHTRARARRAVLALLSSTGVSSVGDGAFVAAAPLLAAYLTRDPIAVSIVSAASAAPWLLVGPWSGALVDRLPRRAVMIVADLVRAIGLGLLALAIIVDVASVPMLATAAFLVTAGRSFFDAASQAILPQIIGRSGDALSRANGRLAAADTGGRSLAGPPLGGLAFGWAPWAPFVLDAGSFVVSAACLVGVPAKQRPRSRRQRLGNAVREGFTYLFNDRGLVSMATAVATYNLAYNVAFGVFVLYAQDVLGLGSFGFGLLLAAASIGAILMGWSAPRVIARLGTRGGIIFAGLTQCIAWGTLALVGSVAVAAVALVAIGGASTLITVAVTTARQEEVPDHLLGRVVSAFRLFGNGAAPVGAACGGVIASSFGLAAPVWVGSGLAALAVVIYASVARSQRLGRSN